MATSAKILVVSNDPGINTSIHASLHANPDWQHSIIETADSVRKAQGELSVSEYQLILADCTSFNASPLEVLIQLRATDKKTPLILINRPGMEKTAISCLKHGADYYLIKGRNWTEEIPVVMHNVILEYQEKNKLRKRLFYLEQENRKLKNNALLDNETFFYLREHFNSIISRELKRASRYGLELTCLVMDVGENHFNEKTLSSPITMYERLALLLRSTVRSSDIWARLHETRFAAILPHTSTKQAGIAVKRIDSEISGFNMGENRVKNRLKTSWGMAGFDKNTVKTEKDFLDLALSSLKARS